MLNTRAYCVKFSNSKLQRALKRVAEMWCKILGSGVVSLSVASFQLNGRTEKTGENYP
jgi:hypothetical protein